MVVPELVNESFGAVIESTAADCGRARNVLERAGRHLGRRHQRRRHEVAVIVAVPREATHCLARGPRLRILSLTGDAYVDPYPV